MTRREYVKFAAMVQSYVNQGGSVGVEKLAWDIATIFADDNPRFDRSRFLAACGLGDWGTK